MAALPDSNRFELLGLNLTLGRTRTLLLRNRRWERITPGQPRVPIDLALNEPRGWDGAFAPARATITIGDQVEVVRPDGTSEVLDLFPGIYAASIEAQRDVTSPSGATRSIAERSNEVGVAIIPRITGHAVDVGTSRVTLNLGGRYRLNIGLLPADPPDTPILDIQLALGGVTHTLIDAFANNADDAGSYVMAPDGRSVTVPAGGGDCRAGDASRAADRRGRGKPTQLGGLLMSANAAHVLVFDVPDPSEPAELLAMADVIRRDGPSG